MYEALYEENKGLLKAMARQYAGACAMDRAVSEEDLIQTGFLGLVKARQTYDPAAGKSWAAWASWHIRNEYRSLLGVRAGRRGRAHTGADSLDRAIGGGEADTLGSTVADERAPEVDEALLRRELRRSVRRAVARLDDERVRRAVCLCGLEGLSCAQMARSMGVSVDLARRLWDRGSLALARDPRLLRELDLDERTRFHAHKGVQAFNRDWTSVTEAAALWRVENRE